MTPDEEKRLEHHRNMAGGCNHEDKRILLRIIDELSADNAEMNALFELQHTRVGEATELWRNAHNQPDVLPDLGKLVEWLLTFVPR